jgi:hypothetical protein
MTAPGKLSDAEFRALATVARARRDNMQNLFQGTHLAFGRNARMGIGVSLLKKGKAVAGKTKALVDAAQKTGFVAPVAKQVATPAIKDMARQFIAVCSDIHDVGDLVDALGSDVIHELTSELVPFLTVLMSGVKSVKAWKAVYEDGTNLYRSENWVQGVLPGDPLAAAIAIQVIIKRDLTRHTVDATRQTAVFGAKLASLFVDFGAATSSAIGLANASATLAIELASIGIDYKEMKAGNKLLESPNGITKDVFEACPLLGCYLITCSDDSSLANFFVADIGLPGWMDKVEQIKKNQLGPLQKVANKAITTHRLELVGLASNKGMVEKKGGLALAKAKVANAASNFAKAVKARLG